MAATPIETQDVELVNMSLIPEVPDDLQDIVHQQIETESDTGHITKINLSVLGITADYYEARLSPIWQDGTRANFNKYLSKNPGNSLLVYYDYIDKQFEIKLSILDDLHDKTVKQNLSNFLNRCYTRTRTYHPKVKKDTGSAARIADARADLRPPAHESADAGASVPRLSS